MKSLLKTKKATKAVVGDPDPYTATRRTWNSHVAALEEQNNLLKIGGSVLGLVVAVCVAGLIYFATQVKIVPYVVEVDHLGDALAIDPATRVTSGLDPRIARATLTSWLTAVRTVTPDIALEKHNIYQAYAYVKDTDPAKATLNEWFNGTPGTDPISRSSKELVDVDVGSILKLSDTSWQVDWVETSRMPDGTVFSTKRLRAVINLYVDDRGSLPEQTIRLNPLGLYIKNFHWTELDSTGT